MKRFIVGVLVAVLMLIAFPRPKPAHAGYSPWWSGPTTWSGCWKVMWQEFYDPYGLRPWNNDPKEGNFRNCSERAAPKPVQPGPAPRTPVSGPSDTN